MAGSGDGDEDDGGPLTPRTKGIMQHFQKQVREYTKGTDNDLQVINERIGQMEAAQTANNTKLAGLETSVGRVDKSLAALLKRFDDLHVKTRNQHKVRDQEDEDGAEKSSADYVRKLGNFRYILIPEIVNMFMTHMSDPVRAKHVLVFKLNLK
jgi:hypothetical protein